MSNQNCDFPKRHQSTEQAIPTTIIPTDRLVLDFADYLRADPTEKLNVLTKMAAPTLTRGRFKVPDKLLAMLKDVNNP